MGWQKYKTHKMVLLLCYALKTVETRGECVIISGKTLVFKWDLRTRSVFLPRSKSAYVVKWWKWMKNWKNVSECVSEKEKSHFIKMIPLQVDETKAFEKSQNERIINIYNTTLVSNMSNTEERFSKSIYKNIWKI